MASKKENKNQTRISGIIGADPPAVERTPDRDFRVGDRILYRRAGSLTEMSFRGVVDDLVVRLINVNKQLVTRFEPQNQARHFRIGRLHPLRKPNQLILTPVNNLVSGKESDHVALVGAQGGDLTIMPRHCHYEGLSLFRE